MTPVIRLEKLSRRFGSNVALRNVSLEVPPGVVFALLGENGAGKTTAIRILLGLLDADAGKAEVLGLPSERSGIEIRRRVGYVPERLSLYEWMTVGEIGWFAAGFYGDGFWTEYRRLAAQFGLAERQKIRGLSKGTRAKVALSLAMANRPELLVLDEPTSGLDALVRREFLESMVDRAAAGQTVFLSSHQIAEVERVADIVAILHEGNLVLVERLDELKAQVRELTFTLADDRSLPDALGAMLLPGELLVERERGRQRQALVRGLGDDQIAGLAGASRDPAGRSPGAEPGGDLRGLHRARPASRPGRGDVGGAHAMNRSISDRQGAPPFDRQECLCSFWRLIWKEYRLQRGLWIAIVTLVLMLQAGSAWWTWQDPAGAADRVNWPFGLALVLSACYALGCGAILFADERQTGTFEFQRALPVSSPRVFAAKAVYAVASTVAMIVVLLLTAAIFSGGAGPTRKRKRGSGRRWAWGPSRHWPGASSSRCVRRGRLWRRSWRSRWGQRWSTGSPSPRTRMASECVMSRPSPIGWPCWRWWLWRTAGWGGGGSTQAVAVGWDKRSAGPPAL